MDWNFADATYVILISGKAGVGKTTTADILAEKLKEFDPSLLIVRESFANGVKRDATSRGWNGEKDEVGRKLLQDVGREGREKSKSYWVTDMLQRVYEKTSGIVPNLIIIDDWRFPDEATYFDGRNLVRLFKVRIEAPKREILKGLPEYNDSSETSLPSWKDSEHYYNAVFVNHEDGLEKVEHFTDNLIKFFTQEVLA